MKLSEYVKEYRRTHDLSQRQLCDLCGLSHGYISLIEKEINPQTGKQMIPSLECLDKLARGMGVTLTTLMKSIDDMPVRIKANSLEMSGESELHEIAVSILNQLNDDGLRKIIDFAEDMLLLNKYQKA